MNREHDAGREYAEIWGETVEANRKLRTLAMILAAACLALGVLLLRVATVEPPRPIVVRVDEVGRAEAVAYEAATAQADPLDPTTKYFLNRFISDFYSRRQATVEEHWTRSLRFLSTELANAAFTRDGAEVAAMAAGTADTEIQVEQVVLRIHPAPEAPHGATADFDLVHLRQGQETLRERWSITLRFTFLTVIPSELVVYNPMGILITYLQADRALVTEAAAGDRPSAGTRSGARAVRVDGTPGRVDRAGCLHSGVFTRAQLSAYLRIDRWQALRFVRAMSERRLAADETLEGRKVCRICGRGIYRALGAEDIRHRRIASDEVLLRRLLSLDYVLEHTGLSWLPTELEKVGAFEALGIERRILPSRLYRGAAGNTRRYFPLKLPVALEAERAVFVYVDPGHDTTTALRSWGVAHRGLWEALRERGRSIEVVAVVRTVRELQRALTILENWTNTSTASGPSAAPEPDSAARREIVRIEQAIRKPRMSGCSKSMATCRPASSGSSS